MALPSALRSRRVPSLPYSRREEHGWNKLWKVYHEREPSQLMSQEELSLRQLPASRDELIETLMIGCPPEALAGRVVLEVGSGSGFLAKKVARHTELFIGVEWSSVALDVARRTCPERSEWLHVRDRRGIARHAATVETVVARHFMIHQPFERATKLFAFETAMMRPGGRIYGDFWLDNPEIHDGRGVYPAHEPTDRQHNAVYRYTPADIEMLASSAGLAIEETLERPDKLRRFVTLRKPD